MFTISFCCCWHNYYVDRNVRTVQSGVWVELHKLDYKAGPDKMVACIAAESHLQLPKLCSRTLVPSSNRLHSLTQAGEEWWHRPAALAESQSPHCIRGGIKHFHGYLWHRTLDPSERVMDQPISSSKMGVEDDGTCELELRNTLPWNHNVES